MTSKRPDKFLPVNFNACRQCFVKVSMQDVSDFLIRALYNTIRMI